MALGMAAGIVLFVVECLDFWRICGNRVGCDCCEKVAAKTSCLVRYQQNYFYRAILYIVGGVGLIVAVVLIGTSDENANTEQYIGFAGLIITGVCYFIAWRREARPSPLLARALLAPANTPLPLRQESSLGTGEYEDIVDSGARAGAGLATKGAQYAAQDARVQAYAQDQAKSYAKQQARDAAEPCASPVNSPSDLPRGLTLVAARLMGGMNVEDASYDDMDAQGDVAYNGGGGTTEI